MKTISSLIGPLILSTFVLFASCNENSIDKNENKSKKTVILNSKEFIIDRAINSRTPDKLDEDTIPHTALYSWTFSGVPAQSIVLFKFDLSQIPTDAEITNAVLRLYDVDNTFWYGNSSEDVYFFKITGSWIPSSTTWNNPPTYSTSDTIFVPKDLVTTNNYSEYTITKYIESWVKNPSQNFGMQMELKDKSLYHGFDFHMSEHTNINLRPKLTIEYTTGE